jgi:hypothetical protein
MRLNGAQAAEPRLAGELAATDTRTQFKKIRIGPLLA